METRVSLKTAESAVKALLKWKKSKSLTEKPQLLEQDDFVYLILTLKKIPQTSRTNPHKIPLPHSLISQEEDNQPQLCMIIDDRPKSNLTKEDALKKIKNDNIPISKIIKITKLKTDYRPFEAKRKLCDSYDMFFADKRIIPLMPKLLGKQFFKKKKIPVPIDLKHKNWKEQIDKVFGSALLYLRTGTCSVLKVGKVSMSAEEIAQNAVAAINGISEIVPKKWGNIRSLHVKLLDSLALPVYQSLPDMKLKIDGLKDVEVEFPEKENDKEVKDDDSKKKSKKKGRIHEVRYMDSTIGEVLDEDELASDDDDDDKGDTGESLDIEGSQDGKKKILGKKRKQGDKVKAKKLPKKAAKVEKDDGAKLKKDKLSGNHKVKSENVVKPKKGGGGLSDNVKNEDVVHVTSKKEELQSKKGGDQSSGKKGKKKSELRKLNGAEESSGKKEKKKSELKKLKGGEESSGKKEKKKSELKKLKGGEESSGKKEKKNSELKKLKSAEPRVKTRSMKRKLAA